MTRPKQGQLTHQILNISSLPVLREGGRATKPEQGQPHTTKTHLIYCGPPGWAGRVAGLTRACLPCTTRSRAACVSAAVFSTSSSSGLGRACGEKRWVRLQWNGARARCHRQPALSIVRQERCERKEFCCLFSSVLREFMLLWVNIELMACTHTPAGWAQTEEQP